MQIRIRPGRVDDAPILGDICFRAFTAIADQHHFLREFPESEMAGGLIGMCLSHPGIQSFVAEADGKVVGSNFLWKGEVAGIGPITVDPSVQNGSIGRRLMEALLDAAKDLPAIRLVQAGYHMRSLSLYSKLGFEVREPLVVMIGKPLNRQVEGFHVRAGVESDIAACNQLCKQVHGHTRSAEIAGAISEGSFKVVQHLGTVVGYSTGIGYMGHSVATSNDALKALISAADHFVGPGAIVPLRNTEVLLWCLKQGFRMGMPLNLMSKGLYNEPKSPFLPSILC